MRNAWFLILCTAAAALGPAGSMPAADGGGAFKSGLFPGDKLASFKCLGVTGPQKGKSLCYI